MSQDATLQKLRFYCETHREWLLEVLETLVRLESPTSDKAAVDRCGARIAEILDDLNAAVERIPQPTAGDQVIGRWGHGDRQVLLLGHIDTVWPVGQLARMPWRVEDGRVHGPGIYDMKAGIALALLALRSLRELNVEPRCRVVLLLTTDEETGSAASRGLLEAEADRSAAVLVLEPALPDGGAKTSRKGVGEYRIEARGVAAHAGIEPEKGASAVHEIAARAVELASLGDPSRGVTVNVGRIGGGSRSNVVAEDAWLDLDVRVPTAADAARVDTAVRAMRPTTPGVSLSVRGGINRPPLERTPAVGRLYHLARDVAAELGQRLTEGGSGGGSDGNFTAGRGVPTIDGLGAQGAGAHALHEHVLVEPLGWRAALIAGMLLRLG